MSDLDNFFAKKDKTKRNKKKGLSNDDLEKKFDEKPTESFKPKKFSSNLEGFIQDQGEWNDFVDEENKDYSGLKIQTLSIKDKEEEQREEQESIKKDDSGTVWNKAEEKDHVEVKKEPEQRPNELEGIIMSLVGRTRGPKINDAFEFPDLGTPSEAFEELKGFQTVRTGINDASRASQNSESIATDNKYSALRNNSN